MLRAVWMHYYECMNLLFLRVNNLFFFPSLPAVLQVSGTRAAIQLRPAGHAPAEEANVQRTMSLQTHPVTNYPNLSPPSPPAATPNPNKMEGQWYNKEDKGSKWLTGKTEGTFQKLYFSLPISREITSTVGVVIVSLCFVSLLPSLHPLKTLI